MTISMYSASVPVFDKMLRNLMLWFDKAEAHAKARKFDPVVYLGLRLAPDMLPFVKQVQIACDGAKFGVARLAGIEAPKFADDETTLDALRERVQRTLAFVESVTPTQLDGTEGKDVVVPLRDNSMTLKGEFYLKHFVLPNFYFHLTTTYALLRHNGVDLGKKDFLGAMQTAS